MLHKVPPPIEHKLLGTLLFLNVGSQIKLSQILAIQNSNHTQEYKYLFGKPFLFERKKTIWQIPNNFTIIKSITIILVYASLLKKKNLSYFSLLSHTQIIFLRGGNHFSLFFCFHYAAPLSFSYHCVSTPFLLVCVLLFSTPLCGTHSLLYIISLLPHIFS